MTVLEFATNNGYQIIASGEHAKGKRIRGVYTCDLLSMAMAGVEDGDLWITVHTNVNIVAVAVLTNAACVVIPESISVEEVTIKKADAEGVILVKATHTAYEICVRYHEQAGEAGL